MVTYRIHFIRHGITEANIAGTYTGRTDVRLCREGKAELDYLMRHYVYPPVDLVVSSPLQRCLQTADLLYPDTETERWEDFTECDFGVFEGKCMEELQADTAFADWTAAGMATAPPGGESSAEVAYRATQGIDRLFHRMMDEGMKSVALCTHGGVLTTLLYGLGLPKRGIAQCTAGPGRGYSVLMTPQMWMRDRAFEIFGVFPYGLTEKEIRADFSCRSSAENEGGT